MERVLWTLTKTLPPATVTPAPASEEASPSSRYDQASLKGGWIDSSPETPVSPAFPLYAGHSESGRGEAGAACPIVRAATMQGSNGFKDMSSGGELVKAVGYPLMIARTTCPCTSVRR